MMKFVWMLVAILVIFVAVEEDALSKGCPSESCRQISAVQTKGDQAAIAPVVATVAEIEDDRRLPAVTVSFSRQSKCKNNSEQTCRRRPRAKCRNVFRRRGCCVNI